MVYDTLTNMELDDELKLRVATRLIDKSVATWWDNLKLCFIALVTWDYLIDKSVMRKNKISSNLSNLERQ